MRKHWHHHFGPCGYRFISVEEEVAMLEKAKEHIETELANIKARLEKLKE